MSARLSDDVRTTMGGNVLPVVTLVLAAGVVDAPAIRLGPSGGVSR